MALVFQAFVRNFFHIEQKEFMVTSLSLKWDIQNGTETSRYLLPKMVTDIHLIGPERRVIIDTKYYRKLFQVYYDKKSFRSEHLSQLFTYVKNAEALGQAYRNVEGMLLYPAVGREIDEWFETQGHLMRVATVNLDQEWPRIRADLLQLLKPHRANEVGTRVEQ